MFLPPLFAVLSLLVITSYIMVIREDVIRLHTRYKDLQLEEPDSNHVYNTGACGCCGDEVKNYCFRESYYVLLHMVEALDTEHLILTYHAFKY